MKKLLSVALSVILILSTLSVLMLLPASAQTAESSDPVNLITNGDISMGTWGDQGYTAPAMGEENWGMIVANNAYGWRSAGYVTDTTNAAYGNAYGNAALYWHDRGVFQAAHPDTTVSAPSMQVNKWNQSMQDIKLEAGKTYKVSASATFLPVASSSNYTAWFDIAIVNKGGQFIDTVNNKFSAVTGKDYDLCDANDDVYESIYVDTSVEGFPTFAYNDVTYWDFGDFENYSFTFDADDVIADYGLTADGDGYYTATLAFQNSSSLVMIVDDVSVYEVSTITATAGGYVDIDSVLAGTTATVTARPYYGNGFEGWYDAEGKLITTDAVYTGVVAGDMTAKFTVYNQIVDGDFESGTTAGLDVMLNTPRYTSMGFEPALVTPGGSTASSHGNYAAEINPTEYGTSMPQFLNFQVTIEKNKTYMFEYATFGLNPDMAEPRFNTYFWPSANISWPSAANLPAFDSFTYNFYSEATGVSANVWTWIGAATAQTSFFQMNSASNLGIYKPNEWMHHRYIFESGENEALFGTADSITLNLFIGFVNAAGNDIQLDNMFFGEVATSVSVPSATEGGYIEGVSTSAATPMYIKSTASGAAFGTNDQSVSYYPVMASGDELTAKAYYGNKFLGWYESAADDAAILTDSAVYAGGKPDVVAKFEQHNLIDNGDFENGTPDVYVKNSAYGATVMTEEDGNKYFRMETTTTGNDLYAFQFNFSLERDKKYIISYDLRSGVDEEGNLLSTSGSAFRRMMLQHNGNQSYTWSKMTFADSYTFVNGNDYSYQGAFDPFPSGGTDLNPTGSSNSFPGTFTKSDSDWTSYSIILDTSSVVLANGTDITDSLDLGLNFGPNGGCTMVLDIDNIVVSEVVNEVTVSAADNGFAMVDRIASTATLPVTFTAFPVDGTYAFASWTDAEGNVVSDVNPYSTFDAVSLTANFESSAPDTNGNGGYVVDNGDGTYTAKAYYGNVFVGWYDLTGLKSSESTISYNDSADCVATFTQYNQIVDGAFDTDTGLALWQSYEGSASFVIEAADGISGAGMKGYSNGDSLMAAKYPLVVEKNSSYVMQFNMKIGDITANGENTPVWAMMLAGSPDGNTWGNWPKLDSFKMTLQALSDPSKQYVVSGYDTAMIHQASFVTLKETFGDEWITATFELTFDDDTSYSSKGNLFESSDTATVYVALGHNKAISQSAVTYDNFSFYEKTDLVVFDNKENVRPVREGIGPMAEGNEYSFTLDMAAGLTATVTHNGAAVEATDGVYTVTLTDANTVAVALSNDDEYPEAGKDFAGNTLTEYDHGVYTKNFWDGDTVYHENAVVYPDRNEIELIYPIKDIVSVRSYDLETYYVEGVDFEITEDGKLRILEGSLIPVYNLKPTTPGDDTSSHWASDTDGIRVSAYSEGTVYPKTLAITYVHDELWTADGYTGTKQNSVEGELTVFDKLNSGEDVHIVFYGDSMTSGWSISGGRTDVYTAANDGTTTSSGLYTAPYAPNWMTMFIEGLKKEYPDANITWENLSLGGKASDWGLANFAARYELLSNKTIDLFLIGWGINDNGAGHTVEEFKTNDQGIIDAVRAKCPEVSVLLYGANSTNTQAAIYDYETLMGYEAALHELASENDNVAATNLTSIFMDVINSKEACDVLGNNFNHANDFGCRIYAQTMLSAMSPAPAVEGNPGDFEDENISLGNVIELNGNVTAGIEAYTEAEKAASGYDADTMGNGYLKVVSDPSSAGHLDVAFPVTLEQGNKYLAHFKLRVLSDAANYDESALATSSRFDFRVDTAAASWSGNPEGLTGKAYVSLGYKNLKGIGNNAGAFYGTWYADGYDAYGYVDCYMVLDATEAETQTAYINIGLRNGGEFAIDSFSFVNQADLAPTMEGAMLDVDGSTVYYVTGVDLPAYVSMNRVTTHMIAKYYIDNLYPDRAYDFDFTMDEAGFASMRADENSRVLLNDAGEVMRSGNFYTTYEGFDAITSTARVLARSEISISDNYGNSLGIVLSTQNTDTAKAIDRGVYSRSLTQMKRLAAKALIEGDADMAALAAEMITAIDGKALWNCAIDEVWAFVLAANETPAE